MTLKKFFALLCVLTVILVYIYQVEIPQTQQLEIEKKPFAGTSKDQIEKLTIAKKGQPTFILTNKEPKVPVKESPDKPVIGDVKAANWVVDILDKVSLDQSNLNTLVSQLLSIDLGAVLPSQEMDKDLSKYGLAEPEVVLTAERLLADGKSDVTKFEFGKKSDYLSKRYVRLTRPNQTSDLFLTDDLLYFSANKDLKEYRNKTPIRVSGADIQNVHIKAPSGEVAIEKVASTTPGQAGMNWKVTQPYVGTGNQTAVDEIFQNVSSLRVKEFFDKDVAEQKRKLLEQPMITYDFTPTADAADKTPVQIRITKVPGEGDQKDKQIVLFSSSAFPTVFQAETETLLNFDKAVSAYRETEFFKINPEDVTAASLEGALIPQAAKLTKNGEQWSVGDKPGDAAFIRQWIMDVSQLKAQSFPEASQGFGFETPVYKLAVTLGTLLPGTDADVKKNQRVLVVGAPASKSEDGQPQTYYAAVDSLSEPFIIARSDLDKIIPKLETLTLAPTPTAVPTIVETPSVTAIPQVTH